jgi:hypothetical protein
MTAITSQVIDLIISACQDDGTQKLKLANDVNVNKYLDNTLIQLFKNTLSAPGDRGDDRALVLVASGFSRAHVSYFIFPTIVCEYGCDSLGKRSAD